MILSISRYKYEKLAIVLKHFVKIFAKMASGENAKEPFSILDTGVLVDLPDHFCLEKPEDDKVS